MNYNGTGADSNGTYADSNGTGADSNGTGADSIGTGADSNGHILITVLSDITDYCNGCLTYCNHVQDTARDLILSGQRDVPKL